MYKMKEKDVLRFRAKVNKQDSLNCWNWTAYTGTHNYGRFQLNHESVHAHRIAWQLAHGKEIPKDKLICHKCDNPKCCNPAHLYCGTEEENRLDRLRRGTTRTKLYSGEIWLVKKLEIIKCYSDKLKPSYKYPAWYIGKMFNISPYMVRNIWSRTKLLGKDNIWVYEEV